MNTIDYFFSLNSVWSYLVSERVKDLVAHHGMQVRYMPVASVSQRTQTAHAASVPVDAAGLQNAPDMDLATRVVIAAQHQGINVAPLVDKLLRAQWCEEQSVTDEAALRTILHAARLDDELLLEKAGTQDMKVRASEIADKARAHGMNGPPLWVYRGEVFQGPSSLIRLAQAIWRNKAHGDPNRNT